MKFQSRTRGGSERGWVCETGDANATHIVKGEEIRNDKINVTKSIEWSSPMSFNSVRKRQRRCHRRW